ncbi:EAL domain-containing protein [Gordonia sp. zg691]|uniref:EAL domain-containing protein n=1 Tax=Gordonia jinghuaiqii TaxID=2758710 RepID=A0A7D7LW05_9ACTN|nr:DICT sensory domain-containing protein [Gordonia jinghuaiqii]MBD0863057.1 EAL domain-containing protein [Gordonia jinghuaiqii]MCR5978815.1 EAL domain-containing protein [Gordonia jinghuaiqii]QMT01835.1 EAL domain-containing protein [Gordonia jinghuaiqii]
MSEARSFTLFDDLELSMQFAPVCRLSDGALAAVELQLRGPAGTRLATASALKRAARLVEEHPVLDERKRKMATSSRAQSIAKVLPLLVSLDLDLIDNLDAETARTLERHVMVVLPDAVERSPQRTLARVARARAAGKIICVDGLVRSEHAATLLSLVEPDIVVTGAELLTTQAGADTAHLAHALAAHTERSHAVVIAEGVDDESSRVTAQTMGAVFGIGDLYPAVSDPSVLAARTVVPLPDMPVWTTPGPDKSTPYRIASTSITPRTGNKRLLIEMSKALEHQAAIGGAAIVLGTFQFAEHFSSRTARRWQEMAEQTGLAGVYGVGLPDVRDGNVHRAPLDPDDDLINEWNVAVLGPHFAALLSARDQHDAGPDLERTFEFVQTYDRMTVTQAVHSILMRFA